MKKNRDGDETSGELRRLAEEKVARIFGSEAEFLTKDPIVLLHELKVYQIELEMQNEELRRSHQENEELRFLYQDLYDFAPICYLTLAAKGKIVKANFAAISFLECERKGIMGFPFSAFVAPDSIIAYNQFLQLLQASETSTACEVTIMSNRGKEYRVRLEGSAMLRPDSGEVEVRLVMIDLTELRRLEQIIWEYNRELEKKVEERTAELREKDRLLLLQSRQAAMGEMIANIAHQWRQPLNALGLMIQTLDLVMEKNALTVEYVTEFKNKAMNIISHMSGTINDFRNYFLPDKEKTLFKVCMVLDNTLALVGDSFRERQIAIERIKKVEQKIEGYPNEFGQVLLNILLNARDAFEKKNLKQRKVTVTIGSENGRCVVTIRDNAGGIPESIIGKIFDPYFTTKDPIKGTGIGLFMSKAIIEKNMGGKLTARNVDGGAEFRIEV